MTFDPFHPSARARLGALTSARSVPWAERLSLKVSRPALKWFFTAWIVRLVACLVIHFYSLGAGYGGFYPLASGADDEVYFNLAQLIYSGQEVPFVANDYPRVLAFFYRLTGGPDLLEGQLLNVLAGAGAVWFGVLLVQELTREGYSAKTRKRAIWWTGCSLTFYPSLLWYSTQLVKDPILVMAGLATLYFQTCLLRQVRPIWVLGWLLSFAALFPFRAYAAVAVAIALLLYVLRFKPKWLLPAFLVMGVLPYLLGRGWFGMSNLEKVLASTEQVSAFRQNAYSIGGSAAGITVDYSNPVAFLSTYSYSFATAMFGPFPWQIKAAGQAVALPEAIGMWALFPLWARGVWGLRRRGKGGAGARREVALLLFSLVLIGAIAIFSDNIGANTRLRLLPWSAFLIYAALKMPRLKFSR